jgi:hypothetical protein
LDIKRKCGKFEKSGSKFNARDHLGWVGFLALLVNNCTTLAVTPAIFLKLFPICKTGRVMYEDYL